MTEEELDAVVDAGVLQWLNQRIKQRNQDLKNGVMQCWSHGFVVDSLS